MPKISKIGKKEIDIPDKVNIEVKDGVVSVEGPLGKLTSYFSKFVLLNINNNKVSVDIDESKLDNKKRKEAYRGLYRSLLQNMVIGVTSGFNVKLEIVGVGYKASKINNRVLELEIGFSHKCIFILPEAVSVEVCSEKNQNVVLKLSSPNKELLGNVAAEIRQLRTVEPYKGKGIRYSGEEVKIKPRKMSSSAK